MCRLAESLHHQNQTNKSNNLTSKQRKNKVMIRKDLRSYHQTRQISINLGGVLEVDGAAQLTQGSTTVLATVAGPAPPKYLRHENYEKCKVEVEVNMASEGGLNSNEIIIAEFLKNALQSCVKLAEFPRLLIAIKVLIIRNDGSILSTALNACIMALLDAGIPMEKFVTCVELATVQQQILLDPTFEEESQSTGNLTVAIATGNNSTAQLQATDIQIISMDLQGSMSRKDLNDSLTNAANYSAAFSATMREAIANKLSSSQVSVYRS